METCYACDEPATTTEHAPPESFFPPGHKDNLITVPSCERHNNDHSMDVEYARNVISTFRGVNELGQQHFLDKGMRSLNRRNAALLHTTFGEAIPVKIDGEEVGVFPMKVERVKNVMSACLTALHFRETGKKAAGWEVVLPNLGLADATPDEVKAWREAFSAFSAVPYQARHTGSPRVFQFGVARLEGGYAYAMRFYEAFDVFGVLPD